jgi:hypothetical protein
MFVAMLAVVLSAGPRADEAPQGLLPAAGRAFWDVESRPIQNKSSRRWLRSYPYTKAISQQGGYNYRLAQDYPWSVRSSYSLPEWAAASTRVPAALPQAAPGEVPKKTSPTGPRETSSR